MIDWIITCRKSPWTVMVPPCSYCSICLYMIHIIICSLTGRGMHHTFWYSWMCSVSVSVCLSVHPQITPSLSTLLGERVLSEDVLGGTSCVRVLAFGGEKCPGRGRIAKWKHPQVGILQAHVCCTVPLQIYCSCLCLTAIYKAHMHTAFRAMIINEWVLSGT